MKPIKTYHDRFDNVTLHTTVSNYLLTPMNGYDFYEPANIELNATRMDFPNGDRRYSLHVAYDGKSWMFIDKGESLVLLVDGERIGFVGPGSRGSRQTDHGYNWVSVTENAIYPSVKPEIIKLIANAKRVEVLVRGEKPRERFFDATNFYRFRKFVEQCVPDSAEIADAAAIHTPQNSP